MRVVVVTMDSHLSGATARAHKTLAKSLPGLDLIVHAADEWGDDPAALERCKADIAQGNIVIATMLFLEDHYLPILPALKARRESCDAMVCAMSAGDVTKLTRMGKFDMAAPATGAMAFLKKLRGKPEAKSEEPGARATAGEQQMKMLRRLPKILRFIPGTAQDVRAYFLSLQYWLAGSEQNIANMVHFLVDRYAAGPRSKLRGLAKTQPPVEYPEVGVYHPRMVGEGVVQGMADHTRALPLVATSGQRGTVGERGTAVVAISRDGKLLGRVDDVRGMWPARSDAMAIEIATSTGVAKWDRALATSTVLDLPPLGALLAKRGDRRLIRASPMTAVVLDHTGVRAYLPLPEPSAVLGDDHVLAAGSALRWFSLPRPFAGRVRTPPPHPVMVPAELRDLPPPVTAAPASSQLAFGTQVTAISVFATHLYVATDAGIAHLDLATLTWGWHTAMTGVRAIAANVDHVVVASTTAVTDFAPDGTKRWDRAGLGTLELAGEVVRIGDQILDASTGALAATVPNATLVAIDETALVISAEANRIVARLHMLPVWSVEVAGVVTSLQRSSDGVLVTLDDGDAYRLDARTGDAVAIAGIGLLWRATGNAITGEAPGGPIPGVIKPPVLPLEVYKPTDLSVAAAIATPWPPPPPMPASWQLTVYDLDGGVRARNDYALAGARPALRVANAPLVYLSGATALVLDPVHGHPLRRVALPEMGVAFSTIVDGRTVVGTILAAPLRVVVF